jgi:carbonic anhydrase
MSAKVARAFTPAADDVLARLIEGNERFTRGEARFPTVPQETLAAATFSQQPHATIIGCSDSRVPPELIFDAPFGELFVIRVAGNVVSPEIMGTLQYGTLVLQTPLVFVLGHSGCGAVSAAAAMKWYGVSQPERIGRLLECITPGLPNRDPAVSTEAQINAAVEANVRWSMNQLLQTPEAQVRLEEGAIKMVGGVYELATGRVQLLD